MQKAQELSEAINAAQVGITVLEDLKNHIEREGSGNQAVLTTVSSGRRIIVPSTTALQWLGEERPRLETKLEKLKTEFKEL